jgi:hypothetical protein
MPSTNVWEITHAQKSIEWRHHICPSEAATQILTTPATAWLSIGFSAVAAGASIYNAYQLAQQEQMLKQISRQLSIVSRKLDYVVNAINQLTLLTNEVLENTRDVKEIAYVKVFFDGALGHFGGVLQSRQITLDSVRGLEGDIQATLREVASRKGLKDAPIPNWLIEKAKPIYSLFRVLNVFLIESHNRLNEYDPTSMRRYESIDAAQHYLTEDPTNEQVAELLEDLNNVHRLYSSTKINKQPRLKWLSALLWEMKLFLFNQMSSAVLVKDEPSTVMLPTLDEESLKGILKK